MTASDVALRALTYNRITSNDLRLIWIWVGRKYDGLFGLLAHFTNLSARMSMIDIRRHHHPLFARGRRNGAQMTATPFRPTDMKIIRKPLC